MNYSNMTERETEIELSTSVSEGLTSFTAHERLIDNGRNLPEKTYGKSIWTVLFSQFTNLYTVAFLVMSAITAIVDYAQNKGACVIFFAVATINMVSGFLRDNRDRKIALSFDKKRSDNVKIIRDGSERMIDPQLLVKGDVVVLNKGDFISADMRILTAENLTVDESIFSGSFVPSDKVSERCEDAEDFDCCQNMLYSGCSVVTGSCIAAVVRCGNETMLSNLVDSKAKNLDTHDKYAKNATSEKLLLCFAIVCAITVLVVLGLRTDNFVFSMMSACAVALCLLPAPVAIVRTGAVKFFEIMLKIKGVVFSKKGMVNHVGEVSYLIFDKGGILTNGELSLEEIASGNEQSLEMSVICSDCHFTQKGLRGSEIDKAGVKAALERGIDAKKLIEKNEKLLFMPFDEEQKLMATVISHGHGYRLIVKGTIDVIPTLCSRIADGETLIEMSGDMLHRLEKVSSSMAERGLKIRAVAYRDLDFMPENIEDEIRSMIFAGAFGYREILGRKVKDSVKKIRGMFVKPIMVTGDYEITAATFARHAGLIKSEKECVDFRELVNCTDEELLDAARKYTVFSGASAENRKRLVRVLSQRGFSVAVAGEQMASPSVAMYANVSFGNGKNNTGDVQIEETSLKNVADVLCSARAMRNNMAEASSLAISTGLAEVLVMMYILLTKGNFFFTPLGMLVLNMFVVFAPCLLIAFTATVRKDINNRADVGLKCILRGFIQALICLAFGGNIMLYFVLFALLEAIRICASYSNLEKDKMGIGAICVGVVLFIIVLLLAKEEFMGIFNGEKMTVTVLAAVLACVINAFISNLKLKGR